MAERPEPHPSARFDGQRIRARRLVQLVDDDGEPTDVEPDDAPVEGFLSVAYVPSLGYWRYSVRGITIDPDSIERLVAG